MRKSVTLLAAILATIGATGCQPRFVDLSYENRVQAYGVAHVAGKVNGEAVLPTFTWLDANRMIFQRYIPDEPGGQMMITFSRPMILRNKSGIFWNP